jgi:hypothetical protein
MSASEKLPQVATSHAQSGASVLALRNVLKDPLFILRESPMPDYGVDFTAEALTNEHLATNWQVQIQLKSEAKGNLVDSGAAISVVFKATALNYLFRGIGLSIIVVYDADHETLYWEWTAKVIAALDAAGRKWLEQETVTVRIPTANKLDDGSADTIRREVLRFHQRIAAIQMATSFVATGVAEEGASATLVALGRDPLATLRGNGLLLVSDGHHREVLAAIRQLPETAWENDARIVLTVAFAYERSGSPLQALHYANRTTGDSSHSDGSSRCSPTSVRTPGSPLAKSTLQRTGRRLASSSKSIRTPSLRRSLSWSFT